MIVAAGSGELRKVFTGTGSFTFPSVTTPAGEYSPVTLNFTSGSFAGGAYAGTRVTDAKDPNNTSSTDYLLPDMETTSSSGISGFSYNATYQYVPAECCRDGRQHLLRELGWLNMGTPWKCKRGNPPASCKRLTAFFRFTGGQQSALPVQLANFNAVAAGQSKVRVNWSTVSETNNYGFEVQKSARSAEGYETIANSFVPGHGTTLKPEQYSYVDEMSTAGDVVLPVEANRSGWDGALYGRGAGEHGDGGEGDGSGGVCTESELSEPVQPGNTDQVCGRAVGSTEPRCVCLMHLVRR